MYRESVDTLLTSELDNTVWDGGGLKVASQIAAGKNTYDGYERSALK